MAGFIAKIISKKILGEKMENRFGKDDPYFEQVPATRLDGKPSGKTKKIRKALPPGLSEHDGKVLTKVKRRAYRLDMSLFSCLGIRFGWSSVIGFIPAIGDALDAFMAMMVIHTCKQVEGGLPANVLSKMYFNVVVDFVVGLVPFIGDVADAAFRANTKNAAELEKFLREKGKKNLRQSGLPIPTVDPSDPEEFDRLQSQPPEMTSTQPSHHPNMSSNGYSGQQSGVVGNGGRGQTPAQPSQARTRDGRRTGSSGGGFFGGGSKSRPADVEMGRGVPQRKLSKNTRRV